MPMMTVSVSGSFTASSIFVVHFGISNSLAKFLEESSGIAQTV
jgi:hypothetical protein